MCPQLWWILIILELCRCGSASQYIVHGGILHSTPTHLYTTEPTQSDGSDIMKSRLFFYNLKMVGRFVRLTSCFAIVYASSNDDTIVKNNMKYISCSWLFFFLQKELIHTEQGNVYKGTRITWLQTIFGSIRSVSQYDVLSVYVFPFSNLDISHRHVGFGDVKCWVFRHMTYFF